MEEGALNGTARPGSGAPHEGAEWGKGWGRLFPDEEIGDWANRKALELRGGRGRGLPAGRRPVGAGLSGVGRGWGYGARGPGPVCRPTELDPRDTG